MNKILIITIAFLFVNLTAKGQKLFKIGERSYPCTGSIIFVSNPKDVYDLYAFLAKEGELGFFAVSRTFSPLGEKFTGKLLIYLDNGSVITCTESEVSEKTNTFAKALYPLTADQLSKLKISNIHTVKYTMIHKVEEQFTASNLGGESNVLISDFFDGIEEVSEAAPFMYVEQIASYPEGTEAMYKYVYDMLDYPADAKANRIEGQVTVQFVVSKLGEIQKAKVVRGIGGGCDEEALRVVNSMPLWNPAMHNGRAVPVTFTLPIKFVL